MPSYVDMMLLHHPDRNDVKAYEAIEQFVKDRKIRSIGLSNWYVKELESFLPQVNQMKFGKNFQILVLCRGFSLIYMIFFRMKGGKNEYEKSRKLFKRAS